MANTIYGYPFDYIREQGNYLVLNREGGFVQDDIAEIQMKMLRSNSLPRLVPLFVEEIDLHVQLKYKLNSHKMLSHYILTHSLTLTDYLQLMLSISTIIEQSDNVMLNEQNYILRNDFIFVGDHISEVYLVYLPLRQISKPAVQEELRLLATSLISFVQELQGNGFQELMGYMNSREFNITGLKQLLMKQMERDSRIAHAPLPLLKPISIAESSFPAVAEQGSEMKAAPMVIPAPAEQRNSPVIGALNRRKHWHLITGALFITVIVWLLLILFPSEGMIYICLGLTILVGDAVFIAIKFRKPSSPGKNITEQDWIRLFEADSTMGFEQIFGAQGVAVEEKKELTAAEKSIQVEDYYRRLPDKTTLLAPMDKTVLLSASEYTQPNDEADEKHPAKLEVQNEEHTEEIELNGVNFIIGRGPQGVHYIDQEIGVSKAHVEIIKQDQAYEIKDLGSANGSFLNEEAMVPYKLYPLMNGDVIKIIRKQYVFVQN